MIITLDLKTTREKYNPFFSARRMARVCAGLDERRMETRVAVA